MTERPEPVPSSFADGLVEPARPAPSFGPQPWHSCHKLIYIRPNPKTGVPVGHWPIPESFWPDQNSPTLVSRSFLGDLATLHSCISTECFSVFTPYSPASEEPNVSGTEICLHMGLSMQLVELKANDLECREASIALWETEFI